MADKSIKYVNSNTQEEVKEGDEIISFRGEVWYFISLTRHGSRVKVYAKPSKDAGFGFPQEFYPTVFPGYEIKE